MKDITRTFEKKERPKSVPAEVVRFKGQNEAGEKVDYISFIGLDEGKPYEIFTGPDNEEDIFLPKSVNRGDIVRYGQNGDTRYDFEFVNNREYKTSVEGISHDFDHLSSYSKLTSHMLRYGMPTDVVVDSIQELAKEGPVKIWADNLKLAFEKYTNSEEFNKVEDKSKVLETA